MGLDQPSHWIIIAVAALLLFGYKKLPDMARSAGKSLRIFKTEMKGMADDDDKRDQAKVEQAAPPAPPAVTAPEPPAVTPPVAPAQPAPVPPAPPVSQSTAPADPTAPPAQRAD